MKISIGAFRFCRFGVAIMVWLGVLFRQKELILLSFLVLLASAILTIRRAPMILLWEKTIGRVFPSRRIDLSIQGMRFAHSLGSVLSGACVITLYLGWRYAWGLTLVYALMKTVSAFGFCPGEKLYSCMKGGCCKAMKR